MRAGSRSHHDTGVFIVRPSFKVRHTVAGGEMESVTSRLWGAWDRIHGLDPTSDAAKRHRDRARRQLNEERAKPAGQRDEKRLQALLREDTRLHGAFYSVSGRRTVVPQKQRDSRSRRRLSAESSSGCDRPRASLALNSVSSFQASSTPMPAQPEQGGKVGRWCQRLADAPQPRGVRKAAAACSVPLCRRAHLQRALLVPRLYISAAEAAAAAVS